MLHPDACWLCWSFFSKLFTCCCAQIMISLWIRQAMTKALVLAVTVLTLLSIQTAASTPGPSPSVSWVTDFLASDLWIFKKYRFDVNLVYTTRLHPNCTTTLGPQPTVVVSTRYTPENDDDFVEWTPILSMQYSVQKCSLFYYGFLHGRQVYYYGGHVNVLCERVQRAIFLDSAKANIWSPSLFYYSHFHWSRTALSKDKLRNQWGCTTELNPELVSFRAFR